VLHNKATHRMNAPADLKIPSATQNNDSVNPASAHPVMAHADVRNALFQPLKIALLGYRSHPFVGGQGIYIKYLSRALSKLGHTVHVYSGQPYPELDKHIKLVKVPSLDLYAGPNHIRAIRWRHLLSFTDFYEWWTMATGGFGEPYTFGRRVYPLLKNSDYDIVHDNQSLCYALVKLQNKGHNVVSTIHHPIHHDRDLALSEETNKGMRTLIKRWYSFLKMQERVVNKLKHISTVSRQSQLDIEHHFKRPSSHTPVIFNGVDTGLFRPLESVKKDPYSLLTTSSSDQPLKGLSGLLQTLGNLRKDIPKIKLHIVGELKENGDNDKLIKRLNLRDHIQFHSELSSEALVGLYNQVSAVICPSLYEGFGLPAAEALACGTALISSDGGALPEVVGDAGVIYPAGDQQKLCEAIRKVLNTPDYQQQLEQAGRARAEALFCWDRVAEEFNEYYTQIIAGQHGNN